MNHIANLTTRHRLFRSGFAAINAIGADRWLRPYTLGSGMILMFHHVRPWEGKAFAPNASLEITPEFLAFTVNALRQKGIEIISIDDLPEKLEGHERQKPFAVLTFDDGYRDNLEYAAPILREMDVPWTLYAVDSFASGSGSLWWIDLERIIANAEELSVSLGNRTRQFTTATTKQKYAAFYTLQRVLKEVPDAQLNEAMSDMRRRFDLSSEAVVRSLCADWNELRSLAASHSNVTIGAHTLTHPILSRCNARKSEAEIADSKDVTEQRLGRPVRHFSYPHGDPGSAGAREFQLSREAGYNTAVTTRPGHVFVSPPVDPWSLPRVSINGLHQTGNALRALISGAAFLPQAMRRTGRRL